MKNQSLLHRFYFAREGLRESWLSEKSFRLQVVVAIVAVLVLLILRPSAIWWAILLLTRAAGMVVELINTAVEKLVDHLHPQIHEAIRITKDTLSGAVLVISVTEFVVFVIFLWAEFGTCH